MGLAPCSATTMIYIQFYLINMKYLTRCYQGWISYLNGQRDQLRLLGRKPENIKDGELWNNS